MNEDKKTIDIQLLFISIVFSTIFSLFFSDSVLRYLEYNKLNCEANHYNKMNEDEKNDLNLPFILKDTFNINDDFSSIMVNGEKININSINPNIYSDISYNTEYINPYFLKSNNPITINDVDNVLQETKDENWKSFSIMLDDCNTINNYEIIKVFFLSFVSWSFIALLVFFLSQKD